MVISAIKFVLVPFYYTALKSDAQNHYLQCFNYQILPKMDINIKEKEKVPKLPGACTVTGNSSFESNKRSAFHLNESLFTNTLIIIVITNYNVQSLTLWPSTAGVLA